MKYKISALVAGWLVLGACAIPTLAHHSFQAEYDEQKVIQLTGVLTKVDWINPHVYFYMDVKDKNGKVTNWSLSQGAPGKFHRAGLNRNFVTVGETYTATLCLAKDGSNRGYVKDFKYPDGHHVSIWFVDPEKGATAQDKN